jgi:hypothetical protein
MVTAAGADRAQTALAHRIRVLSNRDLPACDRSLASRTASKLRKCSRISGELERALDQYIGDEEEGT